MWYSNYETLVEALKELSKKGYTEDFNLKPNGLLCRNDSLNLNPDDFKVDDIIRFDGATNPADEAILYAISSEKFNLKGILVNGYGISSEILSPEMTLKLRY